MTKRLNLLLMEAMSKMSEENDDDIDDSRINTRVREERREKKEQEWRRQPIELFLDYKQGEIIPNHHRTIESAIYRFKTYLIEEIAPEKDADIRGVRDAVKSDVESFRDTVLKQDPNLSDVVVAQRLAYLNQFYDQLEQRNAIIGNPVTRPLEEFREDHDLESDRPHIPFDRMKRFVNWLTQPFSRAFWLAGLKHGTRLGEVLNIDLRCLNLDHPIYQKILNEHDVQLDKRVGDKSDTLLIYEGFNEGEEIEGEVRDRGNKRKEDGGSVLPIDSEFKTALLGWLLVRPPTYGDVVHPLFTICADSRRATKPAVHARLWKDDIYVDCIQHFAEEESPEDCPACGEPLIEENFADANKPGRRFRCRGCNEKYWRSIYWDTKLKTSQKMTYHQTRHYFSNAHSPAKTNLHDGAIPNFVRKKRIRGDSNKDGDTEDLAYMDKSHEDYDRDVREPYLDGVYKFDIYPSVIPAVGEGWEG